MPRTTRGRVTTTRAASNGTRVKGTSVRSRTLGPEMDVFGPGGALERALPEYEPRPEQAALAAEIERAFAYGRAPRRRGRNGRRQEPRLPDPGARVGAAGRSSRPRRRRSRSSCSAKDVPIAAAAIGRPVDARVLKGRANYLCRRQLQGFQPFLLPGGNDGAAWEAMQSWLDDDGDRRPRRARDRAVGRAMGRALRRSRPLLRPPVPVRLRLLRRGGARTRGRGRPRDRQPRALLRARRLRGRACCPSTTRSSSTRRTGSRSRRRRGSAGASRGKACDGSPTTSSARAARRSAPLPGTRARSGREDWRSAPARGRAGGRAATASAKCRPSRRSFWSTRSAISQRRCTGRREDLDALSRRALAAAGEVESCLEPGLERVVWSEAGRARLGAGRCRRGAARAACGRTGRPRSSCPQRLRRVRTRRSSGAGSASTTRAKRSSARRTTSPTRRCSTCRAAMPDPRGDGFTERAAEEIVSLLALSEGRALVLTSSYRALAVVPRSRARPRAVRRARPGRGAARAAARAVPRRGRLGAARDVDVLAGRRRPR